MSRLRAESGMTLVEAMVGILLLAGGIAALLTSFESTRRLGTVSWKEAAMAQAGEQEMQRMESIQSWANVALTTSSIPTKTTTTDTNDPTYYQSTCSSSTCYQFDQSSGGSSTTEPVVTSSTGDSGANPRTITVPSPVGGTGALVLKVYRYVTTPATTGSAKVCDSCRRIVIAVDNQAGYPKKPLVMSTLVMDKSTSSSLSGSNATCDNGGTTVQCSP